MRREGLAKLRRLPEEVSGKAILAVLAALGDHIDNETGEAWPSQRALAEESGQGPRTVERALKAARRLGWIVEVAPGVPNVRGTTYRATVPDPGSAGVGDGRQFGDHSTVEMVASTAGDGRQYGEGWSPVTTEMVASSGEQTLTKNSQIGTLIEERRPLAGATKLPVATEGDGEVNEEPNRDSLSTEERDRVHQVWEEVYEKAAEYAELKLTYGEPLTWQERKLLIERRPYLLAPSFDD